MICSVLIDKCVLWITVQEKIKVILIFVILWDHKFSLMWLTICMRLFPPCEVMTRRSGLRLLTIWGLGGGGGDLARTTFPKLLPFETVRSPGEALALVYPLATKWKKNQEKAIGKSNRWAFTLIGKRPKGFLVYCEVTGIWRNAISKLLRISKTGKFSNIQSDPKVIAQLINHNIRILKLSKRNARTGNMIVK